MSTSSYAMCCSKACAYVEGIDNCFACLKSKGRVHECIVLCTKRRDGGKVDKGPFRCITEERAMQLVKDAHEVAAILAGGV